MIQIEQVRKKFEKSLVLENVNLTVKKGSIYGLLGSNGAGKTTLLKAIAGIIKQDQGRVQIDGMPVFENSLLKERIVFIPDQLYFFSQSTTKQMASFYANMYPDWDQQRFEHIQQLLDLNPRAKIHKFSKGMQRQVAFWLALCAKPDYFILDEPFDGLDPVIRRKIKSWIIQDVAERDMTVLVSSHNLQEVEDICDAIGVIHRGKLLIENSLDDLKSDTHKVQFAFKQEVDDSLFTKLEIVEKEQRGSVYICVVRGSASEIEETIAAYHPVIFDLLPLTLEEIFIYEMEEAGYAIENILL
ncbi:ABC transporter ATP-binding protein [Gracilibacillus alcaliphilus]|uniref:ABC transporter ATP-binding protein n=1 Tax=Gracilibacillus alcaliphilus TaxID=1401441 RepID=UPI0019563CBE|nr:ABC transporter ATP-binding protein [Gracilibacillus alcaliphilus]MBM7675820.1 ABC-2 type transport system ATP-binding protein [Gracilibacillus alcaliphilus]